MKISTAMVICIIGNMAMVAGVITANLVTCMTGIGSLLNAIVMLLMGIYWKMED
jgi:hypothetical protein